MNSLEFRLTTVDIVPLDNPLPELDIRKMSADVVHFWLPNGYGVLCAKGAHNYCGPTTAELAVLSGNPDEDWDITYSTPFADDVLGWQTPYDLVALLQNLNTLPPFKAKWNGCGCCDSETGEPLDFEPSPYAECGCIAPCPDHSPRAVGQGDRDYYNDRYAELEKGDDNV